MERRIAFNSLKRAPNVRDYSNDQMDKSKSNSEKVNIKGGEGRRRSMQVREIFGLGELPRMFAAKPNEGWFRHSHLMVQTMRRPGRRKCSRKCENWFRLALATQRETFRASNC